MRSTRYVITALTLGLAACSLQTTSDEAPVVGRDTRELKVSEDSLGGSIDGQPWTGGTALAHLDPSGEIRITIAGAGVVITCENDFPLSPHLAFTVANQKANYAYDGSPGKDLRLVNAIFPYHTSTGGGSDNILASKSLIQIDRIQNGVISGHLAALSPLSEAHRYQLSGKFEASLCGSSSTSPFVVKIKDAVAFAPSYGEALKRKTDDGSTIYEVRIMNKVPAKKCNSWSAWMMTEVPIRYVSLLVPEKTGPFTVAAGTGFQYGDEGTSTGWSTRSLAGGGILQSLTADSIRVSVDAQDSGSLNLKMSGFVQTSICPEETSR